MKLKLFFVLLKCFVQETEKNLLTNNHHLSVSFDSVETRRFAWNFTAIASGWRKIHRLQHDHRVWRIVKLILDETKEIRKKRSKTCDIIVSAKLAAVWLSFRLHRRWCRFEWRWRRAACLVADTDRTRGHPCTTWSSRASRPRHRSDTRAWLCYLSLCSWAHEPQSFEVHLKILQREGEQKVSQISFSWESFPLQKSCR